MLDALAAGVGEAIGGFAPEEVGGGEGLEGAGEVGAFGGEEETGGGGDAVFRVAGAALGGFQNRGHVGRLGREGQSYE